MGYRLSGRSLKATSAGFDFSSAVVTGAIQIPPSGQPIILMVDHQTTGGYPSIGHVITADLPIVAQLAPESWIEFEKCDRASALTALIKQERGLMVDQ
jgi:antagonist of KipI